MTLTPTRETSSEDHPVEARFGNDGRLLRASEGVDDGVTQSHPIRKSAHDSRGLGDAEHAAHVGKHEPRLAVDDDDANLIEDNDRARLAELARAAGEDQ